MFMETTRVLYVGHQIFGEISGVGGGKGCWDKIVGWFVLVLIKFLCGSSGNEKVDESEDKI